MKKKRFSVHPIGQEGKRHGKIGVENWNRQYLGPRRGGLKSLI